MTTPQKLSIGAGSTAPPLTDEKLASWPALLTDLDPHLANVTSVMLRIVSEARTSGTIPADLPSADELAAWSKSIAALAGDQRNAAYHMLWYVKQLAANHHPH